jgi:ribose 5-phosphate isomerase
MCFSIPIKITRVEKGWIYLENGNKIKLTRSVTAKKGDYVRYAGNVIIDFLTNKEGLEIRKLIKHIYRN